mgnify:CR=1 FL=1
MTHSLKQVEYKGQKVIFDAENNPWNTEWPNNAKTVMCYHFDKPGGCKKGLNQNGTRICPFLHPDELKICKPLYNKDQKINFSQAAKKAQAKNELQSTKEELKDARSKLDEIYLQSAQDELQSTKDELQSTKDQLKTTKDELQTTKDQLQSTQDQLQSTQDELQSIQDQLKYALDQLKMSQTLQKNISTKEWGDM